MSDQKREGQADEGKGRVKEAAGTLTGDDDMKNKGKADQAGGKAKQTVGDAADKVGDAIGGAAEKAKKATS